MARRPQKKLPSPLSDPRLVQEMIDEAAHRVAGSRDFEYFRSLLEGLVKNGVIPVELLREIPVSAQDGAKTRFDQLYDACMAIVFPGYRKETLERLLGPIKGKGKKIWRILLPEKFKIAHVLVRANSFQEAFAFGCDYACRSHLRLYKSIPADLTIRVMFMGERAVRRMLDMRWATKTHKRMQLKLHGREFTPKQLNGVRLAALGHPSQPMHSIIRYTEVKDLERVRKTHKLMRESVIEAESFKRRKPIQD